ncbi:sensor histidine kinase [Streptomyces litchfieldiae]|uniref:histidine kinase n=1 Tax=Streptomyces litchfieldiae TaxID=3075543 RepID=A0ABU2MWD1_9ACTN|nr:histidine kinase [Streptomyces sp. DSM 44938]MDT0345781.1 histidine kinase [Streptomyces sp. DSM 44938]
MRRLRFRRDWLVDLGLFVFVVGFSLVLADGAVSGHERSPAQVAFDDITWLLSCPAVFLRRRWPVQLALALLVTGAFAHFVTAATMVALFTVAVHRPPRVTTWVGGLALAPLPVVIARQVAEPEVLSATRSLVYFVLIAASIGWGLFVRSRRQLVLSLREQAERAAAEARRQAREDIAREMHDVLAHRLSLLSVHAGALEFNPGAPPEEVRRAAGVIRDSAHQALEDLREVIQVLRAPDDAGRPQPVLADLELLAAESRTAGMRVDLRQRVADPGTAPPVAGRTAYRIVQEGLTNARKHAPDAPVTVTVSGGPGDGLTVEVRNPALGGSPTAVVPGAGQGLIGLSERASLAGGRLQHGLAREDFHLTAWLPWPG